MRDALGDIVSEGERAAAVIQRVRAFATKTPPEKVPLRLQDVVEEVVALAGTESSSRRVRIHNEVGPDLPSVVGRSRAAPAGPAEPRRERHGRHGHRAGGRRASS